MQIEIKIDASQVVNGLGKLMDAMKDTRPIRRAIGELLLESTRERIRAQGPDPDGNSWQPLSPTYLLTKKGRGMLRESNSLIETLCWQLTDDGVVVGSNKPYAAIHQLGGVIRKKASTKTIRLRKVGNQTRFAKKSHKKAREMTVKVGEHTIHIPARPYLGVSEADKSEIILVTKEILEMALNGQI